MIDLIARRASVPVVDALDAVAKETGKTVPQIALNWLLQRPTVSTVVFGARDEKQLRDNLGAVGWSLTPRRPADRVRAAGRSDGFPSSPVPPRPMIRAMIRLKRVSVHDPAVQNIEGATLLVPEGWAFEGGFHWMPLFSMQVTFLARVLDPASGGQVSWLPSQQFNWPLQDMGLPLQPGSNWNGSVLLPPPRDPVEFCMQVLAPGTHPQLRGARLVKGEDLPRSAAEIARKTPPQMTVRCARLRFAYGEWEEDVYTTLTFAPQNGWTAMWWCSGHSLRARAGELDRMTPLLTVSVQSLRFTPDWSVALELVRKLNAEGRRLDQIATQEFGERLNRYREESRARQQQVADDRQAQQDRQNFAFREVIGGVETWRDPFEGRAVELPQGYGAIWASRDGGYVLSPDPTFDPRPGSAQEYRRVEQRLGG